MLRALLLVALAIALSPVLGGRQSATPTPGVVAREAPLLTEADAAVGRRVYSENCARCHGQDGRGFTQKAQLLKVKPPDLSAPSVRALSDSDLHDRIRRGAPDREMPAFGDELSEEQLWKVAAYVRKLQRAATGKRRVTIPFRAMVGPERFTCGPADQVLGRSRSKVAFSDLRFYVSGLRLTDEQGADHEIALDQEGRWQLEDVALLDFENGTGPCANGTPETRDTVQGLVPDRPYRGLRFVLGVPADKNHRDASRAPAPLNLTHLFWSWAGGYKFLKVDAAVDGGGAFAVHVGSTGCTEVKAPPPAPGTPHAEHPAAETVSCSAPNRAEIRLPGFDPDLDVVVADMAALLAGSDLSRGDASAGAGCLSAPDEPPCVPVFRSLGLPYGGSPGGPQSVFRTVRGDSSTARAFRFNLPLGFPPPRVPLDNPMSDEKVRLGRHLFFDRDLGGNGGFSCASCHDPARAFTDGRPRAVGVTGELHPRGSMSLANVAYAPVLTWANPNLKRLEAQALIPMFGERPVEMGLAGREKTMLGRLRAHGTYGPLFREAFPGEDDPFTLANLTRALASFERTLISGSSPYDRYKNGRRPEAISEAAKRGEVLFLSDRLECFHCHGGFNFTQTADHEGKLMPEIEFHNTGLYNVGGTGAYPAGGTGLFEFTGRPPDMGRFKPPTLRNVAVTAPYMHDGSIATLGEVLDHYASGGRALHAGPFAGVGRDNPMKSRSVKGFEMTPAEKDDLLAFLESLTDRTFLEDPRYRDPWPPPATAAAGSAVVSDAAH